MKRLIMDLDGTITLDTSASYPDKQPNKEVVEKLREYKENGYTITIFTARNMRTFKEDLSKINEITLPIILDWLKKHDVPFDDVIVGKPWCGEEGFYVDDRAIRPSEFCSLSKDEVSDLLKKENPNLESGQ